VHRTMSGAQSGVLHELAALRENSGRCGYISLDFPVCTGLSDVPATRPGNGRSRNQRVTRGSTNDQEATPGCPVCHWIVCYATWLATVGFAKKGRKSHIVHCPVMHRTVPCIHRQKVAMTFQMELKRLLATLGL
jgi:hypothetical protein